MSVPRYMYCTMVGRYTHRERVSGTMQLTLTDFYCPCHLIYVLETQLFVIFRYIFFVFAFILFDITSADPTTF